MVNAKNVNTQRLQEIGDLVKSGARREKKWLIKTGHVKHAKQTQFLHPTKKLAIQIVIVKRAELWNKTSIIRNAL